MQTPQLSLKIGNLLFIVALIATCFGVANMPRAHADSDSMEAARQFIESAGIRGDMENAIPIVVSQQIAALRRAAPHLDQSRLSEIEVIVRDEFRDSLDEIVEDIAGIYAYHFTASELEEMIAFYETPTGKKLRSKESAILQQTVLAGQQWGERVAQRASERIQELANAPIS